MNARMPKQESRERLNRKARIGNGATATLYAEADAATGFLSVSRF